MENRFEVTVGARRCDRSGSGWAWVLTPKVMIFVRLVARR